MAIVTAKDMAARKGSLVKAGEPVRVETASATIHKKGARIRDVPNPTPTEIYRLMHPDATEDSGMFDCEIIARTGAGEVKLPMKNGRVETDSMDACKALVAQGYRWMNEPF
jgi:hypothetical protein